ncbi:M14 family metallopeptidase [Paraburkholderia susongensis]|uniref:Zinc carboxypeptidase n=1 Tax=Paraburkholderia susongensis TaxID=1515439 RepID=A0A1X7LXC5_9BURK|nr:M14 family metallopeptidase [Paraburkholderia susongensis]SMG58566.1 Protein of unknown function [Paraburkholderia susongensis]
MVVESFFSQTYAEARDRFIEAAEKRAMNVQRADHPDKLGPNGETLSIDVALYSPEHAKSVLMVTSGTHGVEGFCGSGCQTALLNDGMLFDELLDGKIALLLVHAVNPYGFAHLRRVNEDNVDLNRNATDFRVAAAANPLYKALDPLLLPATWPPGETDDAALLQYIHTHGERALRDVTSKGQYEVTDGMFYGGNTSCWSTQQLRASLATHVSRYERMVWIDIHTGLGPYGHGEKIFMSRDAAELQRARDWWGSDVKPIFEPGSVSTDAQGPLLNLVYEECPSVEKTTLGLEFGTLERFSVLSALRAEHWLHRHPEAPAEQAAQIRRDLKDAFYCDAAAWKGMVYAQTRVAALQAIIGLARTNARS